MTIIECPRCHKESSTEHDRLSADVWLWTCRSCERTFKVRTVFFQHVGILSKDIPKKIKRLRAERKMTQAELAELVGVTGTYISHIENGNRQPSLDVIQRVFEALGAHDEVARL